MNIRNLLMRALVSAFALLIGSQAFAARTTTFLHGDGLGSVVAATNEAGAVLWRKDYAPFGEQIQAAPVAERASYTGKPHDDVTGLTYFGGRNFDPELGRFVSVDRVAFIESNTMSFNRYLYVNNNPYKYVDPDGELLNFALKFVFDVAINIAINYVTTGEMNVGGALKDSALGILNPAKSVANIGRLGMVMAKANKVTPDPGAVAGFAQKVTTKSRSTVEANKKAGDAYRDQVADDLRKAGRDVTTEVTKKTPFGRRVIDVEVSKGGKPVGGIETKVGNSRYLPSQRAKDEWLRQNDYPMDLSRKK
jgi:RHS repeat-associated protein